MNMDIIITIILSTGMLIFMIFPAMKISEFISVKKKLSDKAEDILTIIFTVILSLSIGLFLKLF